MSLLANPVVADTVSRLFARTVNPAPKVNLRFPGIAGRTSVAAVPTRHGTTTATIYHPPDSDTRPGAYVNVHGGGFVVGHPEQDDPWCRYLAAQVNVVVVNVDYVLAPRYRFPAPVEQIYDVVQWAARPERDWDGTRLCVGGQSAGGNLSAGAARLALEHDGPEIKLQVLHYAPLDLVTPTKDKHSPAGAKAVMRPWMGEVFDTAYIPDPAQRRHRLASPAWGDNADHIAGIAPGLVVTAELDRLRGEAATYAEKLDAAGALAEYQEVSGVDHGYNIMGDSIETTQRLYDVIAGHVARAVGATNEGSKK